METLDTVLLERWINQRDAEAMAQIVNRYSRMVFHTCRRILGDAAEAEDVTQESFLRLAGLRSPGRSVPGLLHTIATRQALNRLRGDKRRRQREQQYFETRAHAAEPDWNDVQHYVDEAIAGLGENLRTPVIRHFLQGATHETIARELGMSRANVSYRIDKAIQQIRAGLRARGVEVGVFALGSMLAAEAANAAEALPLSLTESLGRLALSGIRPSAKISVFNSLSRWKGGLAMKTPAIFSAVLMMVAGSVALHSYRAAQANAQPVTQAPAEPKEAQAQEPAPASQTTPEPPPAPESVKRVIYVHVTSDSSFPRPGTNASDNWPFKVYRGPEADEDGNLKLTLDQPGPVSCMASNYNANRAALFMVYPETTRVDVKLDCILSQLSGRVTNVAGEPVPVAAVELLITDAQGTQYLSKPEVGDVQGYWSSNIPCKNGYCVQARVVVPEGTPPTEWTAPIPLTDVSYAAELPDIMLPPEIADKAKRSILALGLGECAIRQITCDDPRARYGGYVHDLEGNPIAGAVVDISFDRGVGVGYFSKLASTDAKGHWSTVAPANLPQLEVAVSHKKFIPSREDKSFLSPSLAALREGNGVMVMQAGIEVKGIVRDETGKPVPDVLVYHNVHSWSDWPIEDVNSIRTAADGTFTLSCMPQGQKTLHVLKSGLAPVTFPLDVMPGMPPVNIVLGIGGTVKGQVHDENGAPLADVTVQSSMDAPTIRMAVDASGNYTVEHVPTNTLIELDFRAPGHYGTSIEECVAGKTYDVTLYKRVVLTGQVVDDQTGTPVTNFEVANGWQIGSDKELRLIDTSDPSKVSSADGSFSKEVDGIFLRNPQDVMLAVQIRAEGYIPTWSPLHRPGDPIQAMVVRLQKGEAIHGTILSPDGTPAKGATVVWNENGRCMVANGNLMPGYSHAVETAQTGDDGAFELPAARAAGIFLALHETGYVLYEPGKFVNGSTITLTPWVTIEGSLPQGDTQPGKICVIIPPSRVSWNIEETTREDGTFTINYVPAMPMTLGKVGMMTGARVLTRSIQLDPQPGEKLTVELEAGDCEVSGTLIFNLRPEMQTYCKPENINVYAKGLALNDEGLSYGATATLIGLDKFVFDELKPGEYTLVVQVVYQKDRYNNYATAGAAYLDFVVPEQCQPIELPPVEVK